MSDQQSDEAAADYYTDVLLCGASINEEHVHTAFLAGLAHERQKKDERVAGLIEALNSIIAQSHSWIITMETGAIEKPIHDSYRRLANKAIEKWRGK